MVCRDFARDCRSWAKLLSLSSLLLLVLSFFFVLSVYVSHILSLSSLFVFRFFSILFSPLFSIFSPIFFPLLFIIFLSPFCFWFYVLLFKGQQAFPCQCFERKPRRSLCSLFLFVRIGLLPLFIQWLPRWVFIGVSIAIFQRTSSIIGRG